VAEIQDVAPGLWIWRQVHADWRPGLGWEGPITSAWVESGGEIAVIAAMAPPDHATEIWERLDAKPPPMALVLKPGPIRDVDLFGERSGARGSGPFLVGPRGAPKTELEAIEPETDTRGGLIASYDGRNRLETPLWLPEQRAIIFADAMTERDGELRIWGTPWHEKRVVPAFREMLELPFEHVIISHGEPVHDRAAFERALELPPWTDQ